MGTGWRIVDCGQLVGEISSSRGQLVVSPDDGVSVSFPVADVALVLIGIKTRLSAAAVHRLTTADVPVLFTDWRGVPYAGAYGWSDHTRVGARQIAQSQAALPRKKALWAALIRAKIAGQRHVLESYERPGVARLRTIEGQVKSGDPENCEGQAARVYWQSLFGTEGFTRQPGVGGARNGCLDYGYAIIRGSGIRAVLGAGLIPTLGVFHRGRSNPFNLVDDLIEPFRPVVDHIVAGLPIEAFPDEQATRARLAAVLETKFALDGASLATALERLAQAVGQYFEGNGSVPKISRWSGSTDDVLGVRSG